MARSVCLLVAMALLAVSVVLGQDCKGPVTNVTRRFAGGPSTQYTVDPWIIPSTNLTNGSLPPGACPFSDYPVINATCRDTIKFVGRALPPLPGSAPGAFLRAHGVYLVEDDFVDQATGTYRCPSTANDIDLRNGTNGGYANPGRCRARGMTQVLIDGTTNLTAPFVASPVCSGYTELDELEVLNFPDATGNCSSPSVITSRCLTIDVYIAVLHKLVKKGTTKTLVFSCPQISGNQPGRPGASHCNAKMSLVVHVKC